MPNWDGGQSKSVVPVQGDLWWDSDVGQLKVYNGSAWVPLHAPTNNISASAGASAQGGAVTNLGVITIPITNGTPTFLPAELNGTGGFAALILDIGGSKLWGHTGATWVAL